MQVANSQNGNIADHVFGKADSKVTLIEYGDFQCPPCAQTYPYVKEISEKYQEQLRFVFRNFPIPTNHPNAKAAAGTAEAAGLQGKYWEMHDLIYENQSNWSDLSISERTTFFEKLASKLGLNIAKFRADIITSAIDTKINFDYAVGKKAGVAGTPTFYLNGKLIDPSIWSDKTKLADAVVTELKKNNIALPQ
ncbi:thioredoxin domain-containing protein [Candidatus Saccharibacteria bacterium]|nr:thioredoxin domain-containing protein [Candidatus Saccharibacteria bacterium]